MPGSFKEWRKDMNDPRRGAEGIAWADAVGPFQDGELELLRVAALSRLPQYCPDDGLDLLGLAYAIERFPGESHDSYRGRLVGAIPTYVLGGSAEAVIASLQAYGFVDVQVLAVFDPPAPIAPATSATSYSEFYVFIGPNFGSTGVAATILGSCTLGDPACVLGSTMTRDQIVAVKRQILRWKAAHGYPVQVFLLFGADTMASAPALASYPIGRTLGDTLPALGDDTCILGGYQI